MNKSICAHLLRTVLLLPLLVGCSPAASPQLPTAELALTLVPTPTRVTTTMPIAVTPFYDAQGTQIDVGDYSQQLGVGHLEGLSALAQEMTDKKEALTPEQMYVLAIRFYDLGDRDQAVYWYYEAQFRARLFQQAIEPVQMVRVGEPAFELSTAYDSFQQKAGEFINGYAGCDLENWVRIASLVVNDNPSPPELDQLFPDVLFVERAQWQNINNEVAAGLSKLIDYISKNGESIKQQRAQQNMDQYCS